MGIEPTRDLFKPHAGFEDQERHQAACHLRPQHSAALPAPTPAFSGKITVSPGGPGDAEGSPDGGPRASGTGLPATARTGRMSFTAASAKRMLKRALAGSWA